MIEKLPSEWTYGSVKDKVNEIIDQVNRLSEFNGTTYTFPCKGKKYRYISSKGVCEKKMWDNSDSDKKRLEFGNVFENLEDTHNAKMKIKNVLH